MTHRCRRPTGRINVMGDVVIERCTVDAPHEECRYDEEHTRRVEGDGLTRPSHLSPVPPLSPPQGRVDRCVGQESDAVDNQSGRAGKDR